MRGLMKFDTSQGTRLCTYLVHWIRDGISAAISACGRIIRTPRHHQYAIVQVKKARTHLYQRLQRSVNSLRVSHLLQDGIQGIFITVSHIAFNIVPPLECLYQAAA